MSLRAHTAVCFLLLGSCIEVEGGEGAVRETESAYDSVWGVDYNLTRRCAMTTSGEGNVYVEPGCPGGPNWTLAVESERVAGVSSPGPVTRSFLINGPDSPATIAWYPHESDLGPNWTVNLKVDHATYPHPSGEGYFTWLAMMDHVGYGGGPLPGPAQLRTSHMVSYAQWDPTQEDASRLVFGAQAHWNGMAHLIEVNVRSGNWGDAHPHPGVILASSDWFGDGSMEYVALDGAYWGLTVTPGAGAQPLVFDWSSLFAEAIAQGWLLPMTEPSATTAVYVSVEVKNRAVADLWHTDFRVSEAGWRRVARTYDGPTGDHDVDDLVHVFDGAREFDVFEVTDLPAPDLAALYNCNCTACTVSGMDRFLSLSPTCEGYPLLHTVGYVHTTPAQSRVPFYRCSTTWGDHFVTRDMACEGQPTGSRIVLGYTDATF